MKLEEKARALHQELIEIRRHLHRYPEASMKEVETTSYIRGILDNWQVPWVKAGPNGTVAIIRGEGAGKTVALRADIDALEMQELKTCDYRSQKDGLMHACGHDAHTAALLGAIRLLQESEFIGCVKCIFQPGEENGEGAASVVKSGAIDDVEAFFGIHVSSKNLIGQGTIKSGVMSCANDKFQIWIKGLGSHGSTPERGADALLAGAALVQNLQSIVSRENSPLNPTVLTIGILQSGTAFNILPDLAYLEGSCRTLKKESREKNRHAIKRLAKHTAEAFKCTAKVKIQGTADIVDNDEALTQIARSAAIKILGQENVLEQEVSLGAEDFAQYQKIAPVTYLNIGSQNPQDEGTAVPHHHGLFDVDEEVITLSASIYAQFALDFLKQ